MLLSLLSITAAFAADLTCPPGTGPADRREPSGAGSRAWVGCVRPDGVWHGPVRVTEPDGSVWSGALFDGLEHGPWTLVGANGQRLAAGQFQAGHRVGDWLTWDAAGDLVGTLGWSRAEVEAPASADKGGRDAGGRDADPAVLGNLAGTTWVEHDPEAFVDVVATADRLAVFDHEDVSLLWWAELSTAPKDLRVEDGRAIVLDAVGEVTVLDLEDGTIARLSTARSSGAAPGSVLGVASLAGRDASELIVVEDSKGQLAAYDLATGERMWRSEFYVNPIRGVLEGNGIVAARGRKLVRLHAVDGTEEWTRKTPHLAADLLLGEDLYVLDHAGTVTAWDPRKGELRWTVEGVLAPEDVLPRALRWTGDELVVRGRDRVVALDLDGKELRRFDVPDGARGLADAWGERMATTVDGGQLVLIGPDDQPMPVETGTLEAFLVLEHELLVVHTEGLDIVEPAELELEGAAPADHDPMWSLVDSAETTVAGLPRPLPVTTRIDGAEPGSRSLWVDATQVKPGDIVRVGLAWSEDAQKGAFQFDEGWDVQALPGGMTMALVHPWAPRVVEAQPLEADDDTLAFIDQVLHCEAPSIRYQGFMMLDDGHRTFRLEGTIDVEPEAHTFVWGDPTTSERTVVESCLLHVELPGGSFGVWSPPDEQGWVGLALSGDGIRPNAEGELVGDAGAWLQVQHLEPRVSGPVMFEAGGPFTLSIDDDLTVTSPQGVFTLPTGELRSFDSDETLTWSVQHRWSAATRVDEPGWVRVGVLPAPPVEPLPSP